MLKCTCGFNVKGCVTNFDGIIFFYKCDHCGAIHHTYVDSQMRNL